ncbi:hypothetical protein [Nocardioides taihuensis]|jgi:hypothetical protein|uniref:Secreted protein n=1 Tax=Nocardioides taihuensis TaxID=1835606 RepID=A0ABW0BH38_9ACTN
MGAVVVIVLVVLVLLVGGAIAVRSISKDEAVHEEHVKSGGEYLRYRIPEGADPAAIVVALRHGGYDVVNDHELHGEELLISCPGGPDQHRSAVRELLRDVPDLQGQSHGAVNVQFADE